MDSSALEVGGVLAEGVLVADRLGACVLADFGVEPAAGVEAARFAGQRQAPLPEALFEKLLVEPGQVAHLANADGVQVLLGDLADARDSGGRRAAPGTRPPVPG